MFSLEETRCVAVSFGYASLSIVTGLLEKVCENSRRICSLPRFLIKFTS